MTNLGKDNTPIVTRIKNYDDEFFNNNSIAIVFMELPSPSNYFDFVLMNLDGNNNLELVFNRYSTGLASIAVYGYSFVIIEFSDNLDEVNLGNVSILYVQ